MLSVGFFFGARTHYHNGSEKREKSSPRNCSYLIWHLVKPPAELSLLFIQGRFIFIYDAVLYMVGSCKVSVIIQGNLSFWSQRQYGRQVILSFHLYLIIHLPTGTAITHNKFIIESTDRQTYIYSHLNKNHLASPVRQELPLET